MTSNSATFALVLLRRKAGLCLGYETDCTRLEMEKGTKVVINSIENEHLIVAVGLWEILSAGWEYIQFRQRSSDGYQ